MLLAGTIYIVGIGIIIYIVAPDIYNFYIICVRYIQFVLVSQAADDGGDDDDESYVDQFCGFPGIVFNF